MVALCGPGRPAVSLESASMTVSSEIRPVTAGVEFSIAISLDAPQDAALRARIARHLRGVAERIEAGEDLGEIRDRHGAEIGWFDLLPEDI